jgi:hypothetical protein
VEEAQFVHYVRIKSCQDNVAEVAGSNVMMNPGNDIAGGDLLVHRDELNTEASTGGGDGVTHPPQFGSRGHGQKSFISHDTDLQSVLALLENRIRSKNGLRELFRS